jgi:hypothetical protein
MTTKRCTRCRKTLPRDEQHFHVDYRNPDGTPHRFKSQCKDCARISGRAARKRHKARMARLTSPVDLEAGVMLNIDPFRAWLRRLVLLYGQGLAAEKVGVAERVLHRWLHESRSVHIDNVDRALIREGSTDLWELYPELYRAEEAA